MVCNVQNNVRTMRLAAVILGLGVCAPTYAATLEKLTVSSDGAAIHDDCAWPGDRLHG